MALDRYADACRGEDLGLGADEPEIQRFTRPTDRVCPVEEKTPPTHPAKNVVEGNTNPRQED